MIRVVAYNTSGAPDGRAVAAVLAGLGTDIALLVGAPRRLATRRIARDAGLDLAVHTGGRHGAAALLTGARAHVVTTHVHRLADVDGAPPRAAAVAVLDVGALGLGVASVGLGPPADARVAHAREVAAVVDALAVPAVLGVDGDEPPSAPVARHLAEGRLDAFAVAGQGRGETYPNPEPTVRRHLVLVHPTLVVARCLVPDGADVLAAGTHRPVVVDLADTDRDADRDHDRETLPSDATDDTAEPAA